MTLDIGQTLLTSLNNGLTAIAVFVPKFIAGAIILFVGIIVASVLRQIVLEILKALKVEVFLKRYGVPEIREEFRWTNLLAEIVRWFVIVIFLLPTTDVWGLNKVGTLLNDLLLYLPNVFVSAIIALIGFALAKLSHDVILASGKGMSAETANTIASVTRWAINIFIILVVLNQLGVATDLIRILFTGFVVMLAIAGGIAFGLGGQDSAKGVLEHLRRKLK